MSDPLPVEGARMYSGCTCERDTKYEYVSSDSMSDYVAQSEIVDYMDEAGGLTIGQASGGSIGAVVDATVDTDISKFFARPLRIDTYTWLESDVNGTNRTIYPWHLWATNAYVQNKLNNYAFLRGDLHVKVVINASPFYCGLTQMAYLPCSGYKSSTIVNDAANRWFIPLSQRPHLYIDPQVQEAGEMVLPFILHTNFLDNTVATAYTNMGQLDFTVYSVLSSANGATGTGVSITTYAWMENVILSGATVGYAAQSDEYGEGCVSKPASALARASSYFEAIPIIGPFATATRIGASAVSSIASLFGFTNVPVIRDTVPQRPEPFPKLASSDIGYPLEKLTLDPKNELSIDPRIVGLSDGTDEMMITSIAGRESYLTQFFWTSAQTTDTLLFYSRVNPRLYDNDNQTIAKLYMTPMCFVCNMFDHWRGDIIFKFKIVATKYHKGRLRISFDPSNDPTRDLSTITNSTNIVHTVIVDIGETHEVEVRLPYQQARAFLAIRPSVTAAEKGWAINSAFGTYPYNEEYDNGVITVRVLNILTAPIAAADVNVMVYVKAAENFELANPTNVDPSHKLSYYAAQSEEFQEIQEDKQVTCGKKHSFNQEQYKVNFGENVRSIRQLLRRYEFHSTNWFDVPLNATNAYHVALKHFYKPPTTPGYLTGAPETANMIVGVGTYAYNFCQFTAIAYVSNAYLAYRGSINWTFNPLTSGDLPPEMRVTRNNVNGYLASYATVTTALTSKSVAARAVMNSRFSGLTAQAITNTNTNSGMNVQCPMYCNTKFQYTVPSYANQGVSTDGSILDQFTLEVVMKTNASATASPLMVNSYVGIGTDFSLFCFLNVPTIYIYSAVPTGV